MADRGHRLVVPKPAAIAGALLAGPRSGRPGTTARRCGRSRGREKKRVFVDSAANRRSTHAEVTTRGARIHTRRPSRGARSFPGNVGNGRRMDARQGSIRIFSPPVPRAEASHPNADGSFLGRRRRAERGSSSALASLEMTVPGVRVGQSSTSPRFFIFSETPLPPRRSATCHSGFTRCAIPRTVRSRETPRTHQAFADPGFARSRIRASWGSAPVRLRQAVGAGPGTRMAG
jgi:hypothetical protein